MMSDGYPPPTRSPARGRRYPVVSMTAAIKIFSRGPDTAATVFAGAVLMAAVLLGSCEPQAGDPGSRRAAGGPEHTPDAEPSKVRRRHARAGGDD